MILENNTLILGGPGSGKSYLVEKVLIDLDDDCNENIFLLTNDISINMIMKLKKKGYTIFSNNENIGENISYNPFIYFNNEEAIAIFVHALLKPLEIKMNDFWTSAAYPIVFNVFKYVWKEYQNPLGYNYSNDKYNIKTVIEILENDELLNKIMLDTNNNILAALSEKTREELINFIIIHLHILNQDKLFSENIGSLYFYDLCDHNKIAVIFDIGRENTNNYKVALFSTLFIHTLVNTGCMDHVSIIMDEYQAYSDMLYNILKYIHICKDRNVSIIILAQSFAQLKIELTDSFIQTIWVGQINNHYDKDKIINKFSYNKIFKQKTSKNSLENKIKNLNKYQYALFKNNELIDIYNF